MRFSDSKEYLYTFPTETSRMHHVPIRRALLTHLHHATIVNCLKHNSALPQLSQSLLRICDANVGGLPMKQRLDKAEHLAQQADTRALVRRSFLQRAAGLAAVTVMAPAAFARNFGPNTEPQRYPDPDIIALDKRC